MGGSFRTRLELVDSGEQPALGISDGSPIAEESRPQWFTALPYARGRARGPVHNADALDRKVAEILGVVGSHHTHTWTIDGESHVFSTHLVLRQGSGSEETIEAKRRVHALLREQKFEHITIEVALEGETCAADPDHCG